MMKQPEANTALVRRYVDAFNRADFDALKSIFAAAATVQGVLAVKNIGFGMVERSTR